MGEKLSASAVRIISGLGLLMATFLLFNPSSALGERHLLETFGGANQPSFLKPQALAIGQPTGELYVADAGVNEVQSVKVSATAGQFRLKFSGEATVDLPFNAPPTGGGSVQTALRALPAIGPIGVSVLGGPGDTTGSTPYLVTFKSPLATTDVEQLSCENVALTPLSGGSGCLVTTTTPGVSSKVWRFNPDGTPDGFSALAGNTLDNLAFSGNARETQIAIAPPGAVGGTDGDIYVTQSTRRRIDIFGSNGSLLGQLAESSAGAFGGPTCGVGVDPVGAAYLADASGKVHKFVPAANPPVKDDNTASFTTVTEPCTLAAGAGPSAGFIFVDHANGELFKLDSASGELRYRIATGVSTVTVDPETGDVFAARGSEVIEYNASGATEATLVSSFSVPSAVAGIAVDGTTGNVYVTRSGSPQVEVWGIFALPFPVTDAASEVGADGAILNGSVNPEGLPLTECFFKWGETESYGEVAACEEPDAAGVGQGSAPVPVHADLSGLTAGTNYHFLLVAGNTSGPVEGDGEELTTLGPIISASSASQVTTSAAKVNGQINPNGETTSYHVEYGLTEGYGSSAPIIDAAATLPLATGNFKEGSKKVTNVLVSKGAFAVGQKVSGEGIPPGAEITEIAGTTFTLSGAAASTAPAIAFTSATATAAQVIGGLDPGTTYHFRIVASNPAATVQGPDGTFTTFAQPPVDLPDGRVYEMVSPLQKLGEPFPPEPNEHLGGTCAGTGGHCVPGSGQRMAPMRSDPNGEAVAYQGQPFAANLAAGPNQYLSSRASTGWDTEGLSSSLFDGGFRVFSADLSRGVLSQQQPLTPDAASREGEGFANLYLWQEGELQPIIVEEPPHRDPGNSSENRFQIVFGGANIGTAVVPALGHVIFAANDALTGATPFAPEAPEVQPTGCNVGQSCNLYEWEEGQMRLLNVLPGNLTTAPGAVIGSRISSNEPPDVDHAISDDGSRIFWSDEAGQVFVRIDGEETRELEDPGAFLSASNDGSKVLLGDGCLYDVEMEPPVEPCQDLTLDQGSVHQGGFQGILGASEDLSHVYFVDTKILTGEEENASGERAVEGTGKFNLYAWQEGTAAFIGTLLDGDNKVLNLPLDRIGAWLPSSAHRTAQVSPDGRYLSFMSRARLTGYDNTASGGAECGFNRPPACLEVFEYDAAAPSLTCVSCNPSGQRPLGGSNLSLFGELVAESDAPLSPPHNLTTDGRGRLFFESQDTLSASDTNGHIQDVYEWEPNGIGSCTRAAGCAFLISSGHDLGDSMFLNTTPSGNDAFLITRERLLHGDKDDQLDLYDARAPHTPGEAVGFPEESPSPCVGEACAGPAASPPPQESSGSSHFSGPGNPSTPKRACRRGFVRRHGNCVKKHHKRHHKRAAKHGHGGAK